MSKIKYAVRVGLGALLATSVALTAVGCGGDNGPSQYDPETRPLVLSTSKPDEVFNPFFSTSAVDTSLIAMTQVSLLSTDKNGGIVCGENENSVALDYSVREATEGGKQFTYYQFIIKKGIQFSDGVPLTINDVLFNFYVYLDPAYTGSATIYSTDIVGLAAYRTQNPDANKDSAEAFEEDFRMQGQQRIDNQIQYVKQNSDFTLPNDKPGDPAGYDKETAEKDFQTVSKTFREELSSDYNAISSSIDSYKETYGFTDIWQVFLTNDGGYDFYKKKPNGEYEKDENNNFIFDPASDEAEACMSELNEYLSEQGISSGDAGYAEAVKNWAVDTVFMNYIGETIARTDSTQYEIVLRYMATASTVLAAFTAEAKENYFAQYESDLPVPTITGITALKGNEFKKSDVSTGSSYTSDYDMLQIKINGIDPKAVFNFAVTVAPMHYYGSENYVSKRTGQVVNYKEFNAAAGNFGVAYNETDFMNDVVRNTDKLGVPVGAGVYKASNANGDDANITSSGFMSNGIIYYKRNDYFETVGSGLNNAKIKLLRYQVIESDQIISSLNNGSIDFGEPSATDTNQKALAKNITGKAVWTNGYGYVGVNARFVPNINVRRAIMKAMDTSIITDDYYKGGFAEVIYRSMSTQSWAFPDNGRTVYTSKNGTSYKFDRSGEDIQKLLDKVLKENGGTYDVGSNGLYTNGKDTLDYTFTIAGGSKDHPAYKMFLKAADILNNSCHGIRVKVETSQTALTDLTSGKLQVWAAAWISAIDPDMYQIYHKDSNASSIKNWGYDYIMADKKLYETEWSIVDELSTVIEEARETNAKDERKSCYSTALDLVMELAVELPTYQRKDLFAYNSNVIDKDTLQPEKDLNAYNGPLARIWEVNFN